MFYVLSQDVLSGIVVAFQKLNKLGMLNEMYFLSVRLGKRSPNCNGGCKTENATYKTILEEVKENEGRKQISNDNVQTIMLSHLCMFVLFLSRN